MVLGLSFQCLSLARRKLLQTSAKTLDSPADAGRHESPSPVTPHDVPAVKGCQTVTGHARSLTDLPCNPYPAGIKWRPVPFLNAAITVTAATLKQTPVPSRIAATATPSPGDRFSRGIKQKSTKGHKDNTRPFLPLQERDEPHEIPSAFVQEPIIGKGKGGGEKALCLLCLQVAWKQKRQIWQGAGKCAGHHQTVDIASVLESQNIGSPAQRPGGTSSGWRLAAGLGIALANSSTRPRHLEGHRALMYTLQVTVIHPRPVITCSTPSCLIGLCFFAGFMRL